MHVNQTKFVLNQERNFTHVVINLTGNNNKQSYNIREAILEPLNRRLYDGSPDYRSYLNYCNTPINEILAEVNDITQQAYFVNCFRITTSFNEAFIVRNLNVGQIMDIYGRKDSIVEERK